MRTFGVIIGILSSALLLTFLFGSVVDAAATVVIDEDNMTYPSEKIAYNETMTVMAPIVVIDADIVKVEIIWIMCIEDQCYLPTTTQMTDDGAGTYQVSIGPFDERNENGVLYYDVIFRVKVTYTETGGTEEMEIESEEVEVYFDQLSATPVDNETDTDTDDDDDDKKTPFGMEVVILGILIAIGVILFKREKN